MKLDRSTVERMRVALAPLDTDERREAYRRGEFPRADRVKDLDKRYRWDLWYMVPARWDLVPEDVDNAHIDTALRRIVPVIGE